MNFPSLMSPFHIGHVEFRNRIFSTGHDTYLPEGGQPSDALIAYHVARARGGAGLIIIQVVGVHETARYTDALLIGTDDNCIPGFAKMIDAIHAHGTKVFVQLFHPGRELLGRPDGVLQPSYAPSASPSERFRTNPKAMSQDLIAEIIEGYGQTARRMAEAGADGVEIVASHGYLPAQFMNPAVNRRPDSYGGSFDNRLRFTDEVIQRCRALTPEQFIVGMRYSAFEVDSSGMNDDDSLQIFRALAPSLDYLNVIAGTSATASGAVHIVPPMTVDNAYLAPFSQTVKQAIGKPVFVAGRINQPQDAERVIANGEADMCGMTRAMICDPELGNKTLEGRSEEIRACIGCNQACIGHFQLGLPISCIQRPETGRELDYDQLKPATEPKRVLVVGGGVAGMKAAVTAARRGHSVTLTEATGRLGGQALLAQLLPGRAEFGGIVTNLENEISRLDIEVRLNEPATTESIRAGAPEEIIVATGSRLADPRLESVEGANIIHAAELLGGQAKTGRRVVIYDWPADWVGVGVAEMLARDGCAVRLAVNGPSAAAAIQNYVRDEAVARLFKLGVEVLPYMRLYGADDSSAYFLHTAAQEAVVLDDVDTIVLVWPNEPENDLADALQGKSPNIHLVGDAVCARTCEEAVYDGLQAGCAI